MFLSVAGSDSKCALWQNYAQAFSTLFSDGVTAHRAGRGLFVSADHTVSSINCYADHQTCGGKQ